MIDIGAGAQSTIITGSFFGYLTNGNIVSPPANIWIQDNGTNTLIGVDYAASSNALSFAQRNVFAWSDSGGAAITLQSSASQTTISGNWFGYSSTGAAVSSLSPPSDSYAIQDKYGATNVRIGTNEDGMGDSVESNWFGCLTGGGIILSAGSSNIAGNFFGFNDAGQNAPGSGSDTRLHSIHELLGLYGRCLNTR